MPPGADVGIEGPHSLDVWARNLECWGFFDALEIQQLVVQLFSLNAHRGVSPIGRRQRAGVSSTIFVDGLTSKLDALASD